MARDLLNAVGLDTSDVPSVDFDPVFAGAE